MDENKVVTVNTDAFQMMERMDEQLVLDEIKGRALEALVYEIHQGGQVVTGLSLAGVREVVRSMNVAGRSRAGITDREPIVVETDDYFEVKVYAQDTLNGGGYWGIKRQPKFYIRDGERYPNNFALEQALAKAQRNALRGLIPEYFAREMINAFRGKGQVHVVDNGGAKVGRPSRSPKPVPATIRSEKLEILTREWSNFVKRIASEIPYYTRNGQPDTYHIVGAAKKLGYTQVTDENLEELFAVLCAHAEEAAREKDEKTKEQKG